MFHFIRARSASIRRLLLALLLGLGAWTSMADVALARKSEPAPPPAEKSYALPYALVVLGVALGVIVVARPSNRAAEPKVPVEGKEEK